MDIASRLKQYLDHSGLQSTQFADACGIPRPSFSQLLRGRNRKVSDEVIAKIHDAFPQLSVLWLMFGEGDMTTGENIKTSEPQKSATAPPCPADSVDSQGDSASEPAELLVRDFPQSTSAPTLPGMTADDFAPAAPAAASTTAPATATAAATATPATATAAATATPATATPATAAAPAAPSQPVATEAPSRAALPAAEPRRDRAAAAAAADVLAEAAAADMAPLRKVVSIVVFYSDRSFETFVPDARR